MKITLKFKTAPPPVVATTTTTSTATESVAVASAAEEPSTGPSPSITIPVEDWNKGVQQDEVGLHSSNPEKLTLKKRFPKTWDVTQSYFKQWIKAKWEVPMNVSNQADFKKKIVEHIIMKRSKCHMVE